MESLPRILKVIITAKRVINLDCDVQNTYMGVMIRCPNTFGYIAYFANMVLQIHNYWKIYKGCRKNRVDKVQAHPHSS